MTKTFTTVTRLIASVAITFALCGGALAGVTLVDAASTGFSSGTGAVTGTLSTAVAAQTGDVVVVTAATNKKGSVQPISLTQTGGTGATGAKTQLTNGMGTYPTSWGWYMTVTQPGTFTYELTSEFITVGAGLYVLRASEGPITLADAATWDDTDNADNGSAYALDYAFDTAVTNGVVIEAISARTDLITPPISHVEDFNGADKRVISHFTGVTGAVWTSSYALAGGEVDKQTSGALGMVCSSGDGGDGGVTPQAGTNVLFIAIDDLKPVAGVYGDPIAVTPSIDRLASNAVTFVHAQCQWAVCGPSRASFSTGLYPEETGVMGFKKMRGDAVDSSRVNSVIRPNVVTLQQWFRYHGYRTAATGKINDPRCVGTLDTATGKVAEDGGTVDDPPSWGDPVDPGSLPMDFFSNSSYVPTPSGGWSPAGNPAVASNAAPDSAFTDGLICDAGINLMRSLAEGDAPFFLGVGFKKPHLPFVAPQKYWDYYQRNQFAPHPFQDHPENALTRYTWNYAKELAAYDDFYDPFTESGPGISCTNIPAAKQQELLHGYYACVSFIDAQVGRLLDELEVLGLHTNTIVVLWGDHGFHLGDHGEWAKHTNLEQAARVPLMIYSPFTGVAGARARTPAGFVDVYPTLCDLAGLPRPEQPLNEHESPFAPAAGRALKGMSLVPAMEDPETSLRTGAITVFRRDGAMGYAYRTDRYRYIEWVETASGTVVARELYDYEQDPLETVNLAAHPDYGGLMYQYSVSMRREMDDLKLSTGDKACSTLQDSSALNTADEAYLPGLKSALLEGWLEISWPDGAGWLYNIMSKVDLTDATWDLEQGGVPGDSITLAADKTASFFRVELAP